MTIVGKKSFIIMTLLIPFLILLVGCIPVLMAYINSSADTTVTRIAVIDESGKYGGAFKDSPNYRFVIMQGDKATNAHEFYKNAGESIDAVMVIPASVVSPCRNAATRPSFAMSTASPTRISRRHGISACQGFSPHLRKTPYIPARYRRSLKT